MNIKLLCRILCLCLLALRWPVGSSAYHRGMYHLDHGDYDEAVANLEEAVKDEPQQRQVQDRLVRAGSRRRKCTWTPPKMALARQDYSTAALNYQKALQFDPSNQYAQDSWRRSSRRPGQGAERPAGGGFHRSDEGRTRRDDMGVPQLDPASNIPIVLKFTDTPAEDHPGRRLQGQRDQLPLRRQGGREQARHRGLRQGGPLSGHRLPHDADQELFQGAGPAHAHHHPRQQAEAGRVQDQVIRTFYLSNADAKDVFQLVRSILQARKMAMNQDLNSITIQDSPGVVAICQRIIEDNDKSKGEVVVDVELLEVD